ncbi:MAG: aromatic hydrocarbon degradation protein [Bacteroidota bacterium]
MRSISTLIMALVCLLANAQTGIDVLRYSMQDTQGTARFQAMAGAFGALGGELSALNVNPAGSSVFKHGQLTATGTYYNRNNDASYGGMLRSTSFNDAAINQVGGVFVFKSPDSKWNKLALAFNIDMVENFDNEWAASGTTTQGIDDYFLGFANGIPLQNLLLREGEFLEEGYIRVGSQLGEGGQQAFLGYFGGIIDPSDPDNINGDTYMTNTDGETFNQNYRQFTNGYNTKITLNFSGQYEERFHVGASLNFHSLFFERTTLFDEDGYTADSPVSFMSFDNFLRTEGQGFSFSLGAIARVNDFFRLGGSYQSPTWYWLQDETSQRINSNIADTDIDFINFNTVVNLFDNYRLRTPGKLTGSAAIVFGKDGLLSFDYGYQDYSQARLLPTGDPNFFDANQFLSEQLGTVSSFRLGGEYRFERFSLRGGYRFEETPFLDSTEMGDLQGFSGGLGYDFGSNRLDLAFTRTEQEMSERFFDASAANSALVNRINTTVALTYTLKF